MPHLAACLFAFVAGENGWASAEAIPPIRRQRRQLSSKQGDTKAILKSPVPQMLLKGWFSPCEMERPTTCKLRRELAYE